MPSPHRRTAAFALVLLLLGPTLASRGDDPTPAEVFDGPVITDLLDLLEREHFRDQALYKFRGEVEIALHEFVTEQGDGLVQEALRRVLHGSAADRKRAQLVLTCVKEIPAESWRPFSESDEPSLWAYPRLFRGESDGPARLHDAGFVRRQQRGLADPLDDVQAEIAIRLVHTPERLARCKEEYQESYRNEYLPHLGEIGKHVPRAARLWVDFDADGEDELLVYANELWPEGAWHHAFRFVALLDRDGRGAGWTLRGFLRLLEHERVEAAVVADLDEDGRPEAFLFTHRGVAHSRVLAFSYRFPSGEQQVANWRPWGPVVVIRHPRRGAPVFVSSSRYRVNDGCTAVELVGMLGHKKEIYEWTRDGFRQVGTCYTNR